MAVRNMTYPNIGLIGTDVSTQEVAGILADQYGYTWRDYPVTGFTQPLVVQGISDRVVGEMLAQKYRIVWVRSRGKDWDVRPVWPYHKAMFLTKDPSTATAVLLSSLAELAAT